jgi:hypothetical protein
MLEAKVSFLKRGLIRFHKQVSYLLDLMTDLILRDFENFTSEGLVQILSKEKWEMLGEQKVPTKKRSVHRSCFSSSAGPFTKLRKSKGERKCYKMKS